MRIRKDRGFFSMFDEATGSYLRSGVMVDGRDTGEDPFMASFPELLDVGIMGHCAHGRAGLCVAAGIECYQRGLTRDTPNMSLEDFRWIAEQCRDRTYQFALGGAGDPDQHEDFEEILKACQDAHIVPNFTTSGLGMTSDVARLCAQYCGAVAVSWYRSPYTLDAIRCLLEAGVKTNVHYGLSNATVAEAVERLERDDFPTGINAVIFLLHKPVGQGTREQVIDCSNEAFWRLVTLVDGRDHPFEIGFDSCTVPALVGKARSIDPRSLDTCEGARWSAYITPDLKMLPCSFDNQDLRWAVDLHGSSIAEAWDGPVFEDFRRRLRSACPACPVRDGCMGGCPICPEIVLCHDPARVCSSA